MLLDDEIKKYSKRFRQLGKRVKLTVRKPNGRIFFESDYADLNLFLQAIGNFKTQEEELGWKIVISTAIRPTREQKSELEKIAGSASLQLIYRLFAGEARKIRFSTSSSNPRELEEELNDIDLLYHFKGNTKIGIFPENREGMCKISCLRGRDIDFDSAKSLYEKARKWGLNFYIEDPQSIEPGFRLWSFFGEEIEADRIRAIFEVLVKEIREKKKREIEISPRDKDDYIYLPFFNIMRNPRAGFMNFDNIPYEDQFSFLVGIKKIEGDIIEKIISDQKLLVNFKGVWRGEVEKDKIEEAEQILIEHFEKLDLPEEVIPIILDYWRANKLH